MLPIRVPQNLPELVRATFNKAKANGDVNFYPTQVTVLTPSSIPFQLRFSPSLANKPKAPPPPPPSSQTAENSKKEQQQQKPARPFNPFENPPPALTISPIESSHVLVLNKFAIVPEHFLLITRHFKPQTHLLEADDLDATYACIRAYHNYGDVKNIGSQGVVEEGRELFAFFNCGEHSGASQPHRHLQLLPVARMRDGLDRASSGGVDAASPSWGVLADRLVGREGYETKGVGGEDLPFVTFAERIREELEPGDLHTIYLRLYRKACAAVVAAGLGTGSGNGDGDGDELSRAYISAGGEGVEARISYNLALTRNTMVLLPRTAEGSVVVDQDGREVGRLALNGTVLAGTALVKSQQEWDALRRDPGQLWDVMGKIGVKPAKL